MTEQKLSIVHLEDSAFVGDGLRNASNTEISASRRRRVATIMLMSSRRSIRKKTV